MEPITVLAFGTGAVAGWVLGRASAPVRPATAERPGQVVERVTNTGARYAALSMATFGTGALSASVSGLTTTGPKVARAAGAAVDVGASFGQNLVESAARVWRETFVEPDRDTDIDSGDDAEIVTVV